MLTKEQIYKAQDIETKVIPVPQWGGEITIATMSGSARDKFDAGLIGKNGGTNMINIRSKLVAASIVDENGELIFSDADIIKLGKKSSIALGEIFKAARELNKMDDEEIDELAKN